jgi:hypothetical protein
MTSRRVYAAFAVLAALTVVTPAAAQAPQEPTGRVQIGAGVGWLGGSSFGEQPADLRGASGGPYRLFESETDLGSTISFEVRVGFRLTPRVGIEGRAVRSTPELATVVSSDAEASGSFTISESIDQYLFDGGVTIRLGEFPSMGWTPFASAGAGYIRQVHDGNGVVEEGQLFYVGGGVTRALFARPQGLIRAASVRADVRLNVLSLDLEADSSRLQGSLAGSIIFTF